MEFDVIGLPSADKQRMMIFDDRKFIIDQSRNIVSYFLLIELKFCKLDGNRVTIHLIVNN
jgi:hypothetical protein